MASHSKEVLLKLLEKGTVRSGWGGGVALSRALLNVQLREQFLDALGEGSFIEPLILEAELDESEQQSVSFNGVVFGEPQISFDRALPTTADVTVRFNVLRGEFKRSVKQVGRPGRVVETFPLREGTHWVQAQASLQLEQGPTRRFASVVLDLGAMQEVTTNLASTDFANKAIGRELQEAFGFMPAYRRSYTLVSFDLRDFAPLSPERMRLGTQVAPWGTDAGNNREGDGALVVFMKLGVDVRAGGQPDPGAAFPYPIPEEAVGLPATLILDPTIETLGAGGPLEVLRTIKLGSGHVFSGKDAHKPLDWVIFGDWEPGEESLAVEPGVARIRSGQQQPFQLRGAPGPVSWQASNLFRPAVSGTFQGNTYAARGAADFVQDRQLVVVTAHCQQGGVEVRRHALVQEDLQAVSIGPRMASWVEGQKAIDLRADSLDGGELRWELLGSPLGELTDLKGGKATFAPHTSTDPSSLIRVQHIQVTDKSTGESVRCTVVMMDWPADLIIEPGHVGQLQSGVPIAFSVSNSNRTINWRCVGEGKIDPDTGVYTPPEEATLPVCVIIADDGDDRAGYAMVEFVPSKGGAVPHKGGWTDLATFEVVVIGHDTCYANGWQQIEVEVRVEAQDVGGQGAIISDAELATLQLMVMGSDNVIPFLQADEEGISKESALTWAVSRKPNDVDPPAKTDTAVAVSVPVPVLGDNERRVRFYIHSRQATTLEIYAGIQNGDSLKWTYSKDKTDGKVNVSARPPLSFTRAQYGFERVRIEDESDKSPIAGDHFIYVDNTMDYWRLKHVVAAGNVRKFVSIYLPAGVNKSLLRWASEQVEDHYCSYTGLQFIPLRAPVSEHQRLFMDGLLYRTPICSRTRLTRRN